MNMLQKMDYHAAMIDLGILGAIAEWMAPLPDRSLPNIRIREQLTDALSDVSSSLISHWSVHWLTIGSSYQHG